MNSVARRALVIGGSSEIAVATVRRLRADGAIAVCLMGRDQARMRSAGAALERAGVNPVTLSRVDAVDTATHELVVADAFAAMDGGFDLVIVAVGRLGAQAGLDADPREALEVLARDVPGRRLAAARLPAPTARPATRDDRGAPIGCGRAPARHQRDLRRGQGRARRTREGLADTTAGSDVRVLIVRPGFVRTRMTAGHKPAPMAVSADMVADAIASAIARGDQTIWIPGVLRYVFAILRHLPRTLFRRLPL